MISSLGFMFPERRELNVAPQQGIEFENNITTPEI